MSPGARGGGDYLLLVKDNQPTLTQDIALLFDPPPAERVLLLTDRREATTREQGHGRRDEVRHLIASTDLTGSLDWPGVAQVFRLERTWQAHGQAHCQRHYGITSLPPASGSPARLLALKRGHWRVENHLHRPKDCALGEDASTLHTGQGPTIMACLRDTVISLLNLTGIRQIAPCLRAFSPWLSHLLERIRPGCWWPAIASRQRPPRRCRRRARACTPAGRR